MLNCWNEIVLGSVGTYFLKDGAYVSLKRATAGVWQCRFCWIWVKISHFLNIKTEEWDVKMFMFSYRNDLALGSIETFFDAYLSLKRATTALWDGRFCWVWVKISHFFKQKKQKENWDLKSLLLNYGSDLYLWKSLKRATTGFWECHFCWIWVKILHFLNIRTDEWDKKILLFNYWNHLVLGSVQTSFLEVNGYMSLKQDTAGVWEGRFCWSWLKISHYLNTKTGEWDCLIKEMILC